MTPENMQALVDDVAWLDQEIAAAEDMSLVTVPRYRHEDGSASEAASMRSAGYERARRLKRIRSQIVDGAAE